MSPNARIAVIAPAGPPLYPGRLERGLAYLRDRGYQVDFDPSEIQPAGYLAAPDAIRVDALNRRLRDPDLDALFCVRGGYGTLRLLPDLDYEAARQHPKLLVGYSDITALQLALYRKAGWASVSGHMVGVELGDTSIESDTQFWDLLAGRSTPFSLNGPHGERLTAVQDGTAEGPLLGGNLAMISYLLGTPYLPDLTGAILFVEDVGEAPYKVDALLAQLRLSGWLERLGGLVFGVFNGWAPSEDRPSFTYDEVIAGYAPFVNGPVAKGLTYGHISDKTPMPIGLPGRLVIENEHVTHWETSAGF